jgi:hypothetical protein
VKQPFVKAVEQNTVPQLQGILQEKRTRHDRNVCTAIIDDRRQAKSALDRLLESRFNAEQISVVGKDHPDDKPLHGYVTTGEQMKFWGGQGAFWGGTMAIFCRPFTTAKMRYFDSTQLDEARKWINEE